MNHIVECFIPIAARHNVIRSMTHSANYSTNITIFD